VDRPAWLNSAVGPFPAHKWLQYGLGVLGLLILAVWAVVWLDEARPRPSTATRLTSGQRVAAWLVVLGVLVVSAAVIGASGLRAGLPTEEAAVGMATGSMILTAATAICFCLVWQVEARLDRGARQSPAEGAQRRPG
jgi:Domain of unknown function (DUF4184)